MISNDKLLKQFLKDKKRSESDLAYQWNQASINQAFYAGDQMYYQTSINDNGRKSTVTFNRVKPFISSVAGFMIQTRRKPNYQAVLQDSEDQQKRSEYLNALSDQYRANANADQVETQQDIDMLIAGYGAIDSNQDYEKNPDGEIVMERISPLDVGWDGMARSPNLLDARFVWRRKSYLKDEAMELFGGDDEDYSQTVQESKPQYYPPGGVINAVSYDMESPNPDMVDVYYYQWWERKAYYRAENPLQQLPPEMQQRFYLAMQAMAEFREEDEGYEGDVDDLFEFDASAPYLTVDGTLKKDINALFAKLDIEIDWIKRFRKCYYTAICTEKKVFQQFKSLDQEGFTIKFKTGDWDARRKCWFGMVTQLREPAKYANKALTEILYVIASNSKGGVMYEEDAVDNPSRFEKEWATTKAAVKVKTGALSGGKIQPKAAAALPTGYENVLSESKDALFGVTGVNPEYLGSSENKQVSALLESQRIKQVVTTLASYFDAITLYQKEHARLMITLMRALAQNSQGRLIKVLGEDGAVRFEQLMADSMADEYEIDIGEMPDSAAQKDEMAKLAMDLTTTLLPAGMNLLPVTAKYLPFKQSDIRQIMEIAAPKQPDPMMAQNAQLELAKKQSEVQVNQAKAQDTQAAAALKNQELQNGGSDPVQVADILLRADEHQIKREELHLKKADLVHKTHESALDHHARMHEANMAPLKEGERRADTVQTIMPPLGQMPSMDMQMIAQSQQQIAQAMSQMAQMMSMLGQAIQKQTAEAAAPTIIHYDNDGNITGASKAPIMQ